MPVQPSTSVQLAGGGVFSSDLSLADQREQLLKLIDDFSDRLARFEDGPEKVIISARLNGLKLDLTQIQDLLKGAV
jgi:hypothetical protein